MHNIYIYRVSQGGGGAFGSGCLYLKPRLEKQPRSDAQLSEGLAPLGPIKDPPETPLTITATIVLRGLRGALYWAPIMQRDDSLSDSRCKFSQFCYLRHRVHIDPNI